jgi:hypothetical protein
MEIHGLTFSPLTRTLTKDGTTSVGSRLNDQSSDSIGSITPISKAAK